MVDSEYSTDDYKSPKITTDNEKSRNVPDYLKTKMVCKHTVKKLPFIIRYVPDRYKSQ